MSLRLEMLQVARLAQNQLHDATNSVALYIGEQFSESGGVRNRAGDDDLYYTVFGLDSLTALRAEAPLEDVREYLLRFEGGNDLDLVHLACLARCWASLPSDQVPTEHRQRIINNLDRFCTSDGGFCNRSIHLDPTVTFGSSEEPDDSGSTAYYSFLAHGAYEDLRHPPPDPERTVSSLAQFRSTDGGYANQAGLPIGTTPTTAAVVTLLNHLGAPIPSGVDRWLLNQCLPQGGFKATPAAPIPDLLSTATALHGLSAIQACLDEVREPCLDFVDSLWTGRAFCGNWSDEQADVEYTFYGLLALGHLSV